MHKLTLALLCALALQGAPIAAAPGEAPDAPSARALSGTDALLSAARARVGMSARVPLAAAVALTPEQRFGGADAPSSVRALAAQLPHTAVPFAEAMRTLLYEGALPMEVKAAMGLRAAQVNGSPYVAAHMVRLLRATPGGRSLLPALQPGSAAMEAADPRARAAVAYAEALTRSVHGLTDDAFAATRVHFDDAEIVELTLATSFFNYLTRFAEALRLPVEPWALDTTGPAPAARSRDGRARIGLISDAEIGATAEALAAARDRTAQRGGLGLGMANSQRAMLRSPVIAKAWRAYGTAVRSDEMVGRDIKLQVSFAVSMANQCRYCTLHQVLGLRRLGVDPAKLVAMRKDDSALTPREAVAVRFARTLTDRPDGVTDDDYAALRGEFTERGALEVLLQTCGFAFMNRFTDGLLLPSEDEAIRVYQETYGSSWD